MAQATGYICDRCKNPCQTVHKLQVQRSVTTAWLIVHTTDKTNRKISVIVPYDAKRGGFDDQNWERRGFRLKIGAMPKSRS